MEFSRTEYWSGEPFPSPGDLPNPGTEPRSPALQADSLPAELQGKPLVTGAKMMFWKSADLGKSGPCPPVWSCDKPVFLLEHMPSHLSSNYLETSPTSKKNLYISRTYNIIIYILPFGRKINCLCS